MLAWVLSISVSIGVNSTEDISNKNLAIVFIKGIPEL